ncbi:MAG: U32 family peptidase [Deltaproteobacteria bacterium]|nr:U32 family peptidase [Deltaproteobacteria bacterium]
MTNKPEILAPAGDMQSALAALAAGADAIYLGLKHFSARMQADNFSTTELSKLLDLAHSKDRKIYVAMNTFFKPGEEASVARLVRRLLLGPHPDAIIAQDPAIVDLARQAGYAGEIHFSTLANVTHQTALQTAATLGAARVILPRELSIDEIRLMEASRPANLDLELFVHGALCYCVSGRCWWSSYLGGKSGLRGRCVQPCRRVYKQGGKEGRFFSCRDLSLDVLVKTLLDMPGIASWKIEGRKKGPHYVYYVTTAYRMLRDQAMADRAALSARTTGMAASSLANDSAQANGAEADAVAPDANLRREAEALLEMALGRPFTRARFLPQHASNPTAFGETKEGKKDSHQTSSGLLCGKIMLEKDKNTGDQFVLKTRQELLPKDFLRIGYEDEPWHQTLNLNRRLPKGGSLTLNIPKHKTPKNGTPVFLIDRREPELQSLLKEWTGLLEERRPQIKNDKKLMTFEPRPPKAVGHAGPGGARRLDIALLGGLPRGRGGREGIRPGTVQGLWLSPKALSDVSRTLYSRISWWLPPVIWPDEEENWKRNIHQALRNGARHFVCNAPWQAAYFEDKKGLSLTAGPFCNITNIFSVGVLAGLGFSQAILSPELSAEDYLALPAQSPLPLGLVISGYWPVGLSRFRIDPLKPGEIFQSPKREGFWARQYGQNVWLYPAWPLDLTAKRAELEKAGYSVFVSINEHPPKEITTPGRNSEFNWQIDVL